MTDKQEKKKLSLLQIFMMIIAFPVMLVREPLVSWYTRTYKQDGVGDGFRKFLGIVSALALGIGRGYSMNALTEPGTWQTYLLPSLGMAALGFYVIFPLFYLKAYKGATKLWELVDSEPYKDEKGRTKRSHEKSWFTNLLMFVSHAAAFIGSIYTGWISGTAIQTAMPHIGGTLLGLITGLFVGIALICITWGLLSAAGLHVLALAFGAYASMQVAPYIQSLGMPADATGAANFLAFIAAVGYVFPALHVLISRGLRQLVTEMAKVYDEPNQDYRNTFEHTFNILESTNLALAIAGMAKALTITAQATIAGIGFVLSYIFVGALVTSKHKPNSEYKDNKDSLRWASTLVAAHYGWFQGAGYLAAHGSWGIPGAIGVGILHAALSFLFFFPLAYVGIRFALKPLAHPAIGNFLVKMYDTIVNIFDKVDEMRKETYSSKPSTTKTLVQELTNIGAAAGVAVGVNTLTVQNAIPYPTLVTSLLTALSYLVVGQVLSKEKIRFFAWDANGMTVLGVLTGISTALITGVVTAQSTAMAWAVVLGLLVGSITTAWLFPLAFGVLSAVLTGVAPRLTRLVSSALAKVRGFFWKHFKSFVTLFVNAYRAVRDGFKNIWSFMVKTFKESYQSLKEEFDRLFGRKKGSDKSDEGRNDSDE